MPDISMCEGGMCPIKETCYRFTADPSDYQSYLGNPPFKEVDEDNNSKCEYYWEREKLTTKDKEDETEGI